MQVNKKVKEIICTILETLVLSAIIILSVTQLSCKITTEGIKLLSGDYNPPILCDFEVLDSTSLRLLFSEKVILSGNTIKEKKINFDLNEDITSLTQALEIENNIESEIIYDENSNEILIRLEKPTEIGQNYLLFACVEDLIGNSLNFSLEFSGYNSRIPKLIMTEIKTISDTSQNKFEKTNNFYRNEYIEFLSLSDGNLSGIEIISGNDGIDRKYVFPPIEVSKGEVFIVHLRNRGQGCICEMGNDLNLATSTYSHPEIRDLWSENTETVFGNKNDIIIVRNTANNEILDCIMYKDEDLTQWSKKLEVFSDLINNSKIYESGACENAIISTGVTATKNLHRKDADLIFEKIMAEELLEYPIKQKTDSWYVDSSSAGLL